MNLLNNNAIKIKRSDEFYTLKEDIKAICEMTRANWQDKKVYLPFDSLESEFYKYFKGELEKGNIRVLLNKTIEQGKEVIYNNGKKSSFDDIDILHLSNVVVVSNPPFSTLSNILKFYTRKNLFNDVVDYILVVPLLFANKLFIELLKQGKVYYLDYLIKKFNTPSGAIGEVACNVITTFKQSSILHKVAKANANPLYYIYDEKDLNKTPYPFYNIKSGIDTSKKDYIIVSVNLLKYVYQDYEIIGSIDKARRADDDKLEFIRIKIKKKEELK